MKFRIAVLLACVAFLSSSRPASGAAGENQTTVVWKCDDMTPDLCSNLHVETGRVQIREGVRVKYWRYYSSSTTTTTSGSSPPLVVANGGPGFPHNYMLPMKQIACRGDRQVIFYDQAGCGESPVDQKKDPLFLLNATYYAREELPKLLQALDVGPFHLLGHSWGTMLVMEYASSNSNTVDPSRNNLRSLVLASPVPDIREYIQSQWDPDHGTIGRMLPPYVRQRLQVLIDHHDFDAPEYQSISDLLSGRFLYTNGIPADCLLASIANMNNDIYVGMQGVGEFSEATGTLKHFDGYAQLAEIGDDVPILLAAGEYDVVRPSTLEKMGSMLRRSEVVYIPASGHFLPNDNAGALNDRTRDFLQRVDANEQIGGVEQKQMAGAQQQQHAQPNLWVLFVSLAVGAAAGFFLGRTRSSGYEIVTG